jgi:5-methylcytosine-specific restriction enzyme A
MSKRNAKPLRKCRDMSCPNLTSTTYCERHTSSSEEEKRQAHRHYKRERRDKREQAFYSSSDWLRLSAYKRMKSPLCEHCLMYDKAIPVKEIDHIIEIKDDWSLRLTYSNLQSLCRGCHIKKTRKVAEERKRRQGRQ